MRGACSVFFAALLVACGIDITGSGGVAAPDAGSSVGRPPVDGSTAKHDADADANSAPGSDAGKGTDSGAPDATTDGSVADDGGVLTMTCNANTCECPPNRTCDVTCNSCNFICGAGAKCQVRCAGGALSCAGTCTKIGGGVCGCSGSCQDF